MSDIMIHREGWVCAHLDVEGGMVGVEIPEAELIIAGVVRKTPYVINKADNIKCNKGLKKCNQEISLSKVKHVLIVHCEGEERILDKVIIDKISLSKAYKTYCDVHRVPVIEGRVRVGRECSQFEPIGKGHEDDLTCACCSLYDVCYDRGRGYMSGYGYGY
jgi:hypothetical protein